MSENLPHPLFAAASHRVRRHVSFELSAHRDHQVRRNIVEAALRLGHAAGSWDAVHVHQVALEAGLSLPELARHFEGKDDIADGLFDLADAEMLAAGNQAGWDELPVRERLYQTIMSWLDTLSPHRRLALEMLGYKLQPEHVHLQVRGVGRISRTVQWIREAAMLTSVGWRRELEETVLTGIYIATFSCWLTDSSAGSDRTQRVLRGLLKTAERGAAWLAQA